MITIKELLEEAKKSLPSFKEGQYFEALKPIYPLNDDANKNVVIDGKKLTKPLAVDKKAKKEFRKEKSPFRTFYKNEAKGDLLRVVEVLGEWAKCENLSLKEDIKERFYKNGFVYISYGDIINGTIKQAKRNLLRYLEEK